MKELLVDFLNSEFLIIMIYVYLFCLVFYVVWSILNYFKYYSRVQKRIKSLYSQMSEQEKLRAEEERHQRDIYGEGKKTDFLASIDERLAYSGLKDKLRWLTTEVYILSVLLISVVCGTVVVVTRGLILGLLTTILIILGFELFISLLISIRNKRTEAIMLQFMNIVDNFSKTSDDLISILEKSSRYIEDPLGSQIYDAVIAARHSGDTMTALQELQDNVKNKHFKVLIRNLEISSRYETNYSEIIEDCREVFHSYIKSEKEKQNIRLNGVMEIGIMLLCGYLCAVLMGDMTSYPNIFYALLSGGPLGQAILVLIVISVILALYIAVFKVLRSK